ncbi:DUF4921 family protein [Corynebacterium genitalium ATCC 33030]|uniref:DUF4921 domain-containing protein n=1 Tax=Corynebacterium genitalium ATCC 33030 TaxID=585529 RepID=D7WEZ1_9CORY|nr:MULTISPECIES: DUF4921 family protein [Corynebacterium]EFK53672.1 hypothetical protein HMPREF0291_11329 [Corynebacterium genitalium ATCC 33030]UUA88752.1 DUF4921 family protein [Corynebacterium genitalium ATCC 33030]
MTHRDPISHMADGTIKQYNPFSGTQVWTVPGRGNRPLAVPKQEPHSLEPHDFTDSCNFCADRKLKTPPEKSRIVQRDGGWEILRDLLPHELDDTQPMFRRVPNLFEIVSYDYWAKNYGFHMDTSREDHMERYLADDAGRHHVFDVVRMRLKAGGHDDNLTEEELLAHVPAYFGGGHDVIIGSRHFVDGAQDSSQLASSGTLTPDEHHAFIAFTIDSLRDLYERNRYAPYVSVFQNWLAPAGASFDHLHKQLVAIDERGVQADFEIDKLRQNPNIYNEWGINYASYHNLIIAENDHAVMTAGIGHRYPTMNIYSKSATPEPWLQTADEVRGMSDLIHAAHAATGPEVPSNEEWHHKPIDLDMPMPWHINLKWRVSTLAGFEGGTKVYVNTLSPYDIRDRMVSNLYRLREEGRLADRLRIATECSPVRNALRYNPVLQ